MEKQDLFALFATDRKREKFGATLSIAGTKFQVARLGGAAYMAARAKLSLEIDGKFPDAEKNGTEEAREEYFREAASKLMAKHILVGWDSLVYEGKTYDKYDEEIAAKLMSHDDFSDLVVMFANNKANYLLVTKDEVKN